MKIYELKEMLSYYEDDDTTEIVIGFKQKYGTDFVYSIDSLCEIGINAFFGANEKAVAITTNGDNNQIGSIDYIDDNY